MVKKINRSGTRRILALVLLVALGVFLPGCVPASGPAEPEVPEAREAAFIAQYIRTNGYHEDVEYPVVTVIRTREELEAYREANADRYDLSQWDVSERYDEAYFESNALLLVLLEEPSGSNRHEVRSVLLLDDGMEIGIDRILPEIGTTDMAEWHIFIEIAAEDLVEGEIAVRFEDKEATAEE